jgi:hypothetical protein
MGTLELRIREFRPPWHRRLAQYVAAIVASRPLARRE